MLRFAAATIIAALVVLSADRWLGPWFFQLGSLLGADESYDLVIANYLYKAFTWACLFVAVLTVTPAPSRRWPTALVCGLALAVMLYQARELTIMTIANGQALTLWWVVTLVLFAVPSWLIWLWYRRVVAAPTAQ